MLQEYYNNSNIEINRTNKRNSITITIIIYGIYTNNNGLITYNEIPIFIIDLLNHQVILINTMVPVTVNVLQSALCGKVTPQFSTKSTITSNNIEETKQQEATNKAKNRGHPTTPKIIVTKDEWKTLVKVAKLKSIRRDQSKPILSNSYALLKEENKDEEDSNIELAKTTTIKENDLINITKEFEIKEELYNIKVIIV